MKQLVAVLSEDEAVELGVFADEARALEAARQALEDGLHVRDGDALELVPAHRVRRFIVTDANVEAVWIGRRPRRRPGRPAARESAPVAEPVAVEAERPGLLTRLFGGN